MLIALRVLAAACTLLLSGCSLLSPYSSLTKVDLTLKATNQLNPDQHGRPSPLVLQLVELRHATNFEQTDYFALNQAPMDVLKHDLTAIEELEIRPGEQRTIKLRTQPESRYLGLIASYRDLPNSQWRLTTPLEPRQRITLNIVLGSNQLSAISSEGD